MALDKAPYRAAAHWARSSGLTRRSFLAASAAAAGAFGLAQVVGARDAQAAPSADVRPFHIDIPDEAIADLRRRVAATRWPERELVPDATQGVQLATMQSLA